MKQWSEHLVRPEELGIHGNHLDEIATRLVDEQRTTWPRLASGLSNLDNARFKTIKNPENPDDFLILVQNSGRFSNAAADLHPDRRCPLCLENLPREERGLATGSQFVLLPNPDPILRHHLIGAHRDHIEQRLDTCLPTMIELTSRGLGDLVIFYNGPSCGASSPYHAHFQIGFAGNLPLPSVLNAIHRRMKQPVGRFLFHELFGRRLVVLTETTPQRLGSTITWLLDLNPDIDEIPHNLLVWHSDETFMAAFFPRGRHRPDVFYKQDPHRIIISPGSVEMAGLIVVPRLSDWDRVDATLMKTIFEEVSVDDDAWVELQRRIPHE
jgi:hypothetical protein